eukprot:jgi/Chrzof1/13968/Cz08g19220.t1
MGVCTIQSVQQLLLQSVRDRLPQYKPRQIANTLYALAKMACRDTDLISQLLQASQGNLSSCCSQELSNMLWALGKLRVWPEPQWLQHWYDVAVDHFSSSSTQAGVSSGLGVSGHSNSNNNSSSDSSSTYCSSTTSSSPNGSSTSGTREATSLQDCYASQTKRTSVKRLNVLHTGHFKPQEVANIAWGLGRLRAVPSRQWLDSLLAASRCQMQQYTPQQLSNLLWGVAHMTGRRGAAPALPADWLSAYCSAVLVSLVALSAQELSCVVWALCHVVQHDQVGNDGGQVLDTVQPTLLVNSLKLQPKMHNSQPPTALAAATAAPGQQQQTPGSLSHAEQRSLRGDQTHAPDVLQDSPQQLQHTRHQGLQLQQSSRKHTVRHMWQTQQGSQQHWQFESHSALHTRNQQQQQQQQQQQVLQHQPCCIQQLCQQAAVQLLRRPASTVWTVHILRVLSSCVRLGCVPPAPVLHAYASLLHVTVARHQSHRPPAGHLCTALLLLAKLGYNPSKRSLLQALSDIQHQLPAMTASDFVTVCCFLMVLQYVPSSSWMSGYLSAMRCMFSSATAPQLAAMVHWFMMSRRGCWKCGHTAHQWLASLWSHLHQHAAKGSMSVNSIAVVLLYVRHLVVRDGAAWGAEQWHEWGVLYQICCRKSGDLPPATWSRLQRAAAIIPEEVLHSM